MRLSNFGNKMARRTGVVDLMEDLASALTERADMILMGGGNPGRIPEMEQLFATRLHALLNDEKTLHQMLGVYQGPLGDRQFRCAIADLLNREFGWAITADNVAVSNGSQSAFFLLFNLLGGARGEGQAHILLPLSPEYIGYADLGVDEGLFRANAPDIEELDAHEFKYHVDFNSLQIDDSTAAICVSRPTNPTGNVLTDAEIARLDNMARGSGVPLIIDGAYGLPFPNIIFTEASTHWNANTVLVLSLSKLGLPGVRTGVIIADAEFIEVYANASSIVNLACGNLGPGMATGMIQSGEILRLGSAVVRPFYLQKVRQTVGWLREDLGDLPWKLHRPEGAIFLWLWFDELPISSRELYLRLKSKGVLVIPGEEFFIGLDPSWQHVRQCIRLSYAQEAATVRAGIRILAHEVRKVYAGS